MDQFRYNTDIQNTPLSNAKTSPEATTLTPLEMTGLLNVKELEIVNWRRFAAIPDQTPPGKKTLVGSHLCEAKQKNLDGNDELALLFDDKKVPVQVIAAPNPEINGRDQAD
ncbi:hypothetical protein [Undibacterium sp. Xuan67W]|uniref:hypothetical protein n=1 Tax=Undibacterium sp. Xuan67W TaxID=3413057 RepID=UPI003BEFFF6E